MPTFDTLITGAECVLPSGIEQTTIGIKDGRIAAIGAPVTATAEHVIKADGLMLCPGFMDTQVHFREPGLEYKEDLESGTRGAALGGVTTVFEMPNTKPSTTDAASFADKLARAKGRAWTDYAFYIGATPTNYRELQQLELHPHCCAVKIFMGSSTGSLLVPEDEHVYNVLSHGQRRVAVHAEDEARLIERRHLADEAAHPRAHPIWRDEEVCLRATTRLLAQARKARRRVHVLHVTTAQEMAFLAKNKDIATVEVLPQHLTLSAPECYERLGTYAQMNPPIREKHHQEALWEAVRLGIVDVLASDHAPHTREEKDKPYPASPAGLTGVQTIVPLMLNHVNQGKLSLLRLVDMMCYAPQRVFGVQRKGRLAVGYDADITLVDMKAQRTIENKWIVSKTGWTPFDGMRVQGWPVATIVRGQTVMRDDTLLSQPVGEPALFF
jgi:dihydroorotase